MFQKAVKQEAKLRLAIAGPSGAGKTYTALVIAKSLADGGKVALVDTEHGSASKYADLFEFDVLNIDPPFTPSRFIDAIADAQKAGYNVIVLDSLSHAWSGVGGILDIVDQAATRLKGNSFAAWKEGTPVYNKLIDGIIRSDIHVISTMRSKQEYVQSQDENGRKKVEKLGMAPVQREGFEYEFDVVFNMDTDNNAVVTKTRCPDLAGSVIRKPNHEVGEVLKKWLHGVKVEPMTLEQAHKVKDAKGELYSAKTIEQLTVIKNTAAAPQDKQEAAELLIKEKEGK